MSKKVESPLMFAALTAMAPAELYKLACSHVTISDSVSKAQDKFTNSLKPFAKVVAALKRLYVEMREGRAAAEEAWCKVMALKQTCARKLPTRLPVWTSC